MRDYSLTHLRDDVLLRDLTALIAQERGAFAAVLAHLAEVDARKLFIPLGYSSMFVYCVQELKFSEDAAYKRIQAARAAREFPILLTELAEGRLHLTSICLLAPHLNPENAEELVRAAAYRRQSEVHQILSCMFEVRATATGAQGELAAQQVEGPEMESASEQSGAELAAQQVDLTPGQLAAQQVGPTSLVSQVERLEPLMVLPEIKDRVRYLQALLSHSLPSGDVSCLLAKALDLLIEHVEKRRFGTGNGSVRRRRTGDRNRYIPANVRHAVWNRDGGRCTFVGTNGHRCNSGHFLEFDHVDPRNRQDTVEGLRLRCRVHNQYEAERVFGTEFMNRKREEARLAKEARLAQKAQERAKAETAADPEVEEQIQDVLSALRGLGIKGDQARRAAARARTLEHATLADRIRAALQFHGECV
ncbi:MAG TPA: hypothetical protein VFP58_11260, partial [Candidatus Eisenbacteria bacterium]|nr:hypothetical protein [Candidatus Eisenbacteria bacterium]